MFVKQRIREVGILKTLGFTRLVILWMVLGEAAVIALTGGAIGCSLAFWRSCSIAARGGRHFF